MKRQSFRASREKPITDARSVSDSPAHYRPSLKTDPSSAPALKYIAMMLKLVDEIIRIFNSSRKMTICAYASTIQL